MLQKKGSVYQRLLNSWYLKKSYGFDGFNQSSIQNYRCARGDKQNYTFNRNTTKQLATKELETSPRPSPPFTD